MWNVNDVLRSTLRITMICRIGNHKLPYTYIRLLYDYGVLEYLHIANGTVCAVCIYGCLLTSSWCSSTTGMRREKELCVTYAWLMRYGTIMFNATAENDNGKRSINYISISHARTERLSSWSDYQYSIYHQYTYLVVVVVISSPFKDIFWRMCAPQHLDDIFWKFPS